MEHGAAEVLDLGESQVGHGACDVGEQVEGRVRLVATEAGYLVQDPDRRVAPLLEDRDYPAGPALVAREALDGAVLDEVVGTGLVVDVELGEHLDDLARTDGGAQAPAGHGELLGEGVEDDAALGHARAATRGRRWYPE